MADVCIEGPEERLIGPVKMIIKDKIRLEFDYEEKEIIIQILEIILNNPYCHKMEIKESTLNNKKINLEEIEKKIEKSNILQIEMGKEANDYYKKCLFYIVLENYPEDYFLDKEFEKW